MKPRIDDRVTQQHAPLYPTFRVGTFTTIQGQIKVWIIMGYFVWKKKTQTQKKDHFPSIRIETVRTVVVNVVSELIIYCSVAQTRKFSYGVSLSPCVRPHRLSGSARGTDGKVNESHTYLAFVLVKGKPPYSS